MAPPARVITAIVQKGAALPALRALREELGVVMANIGSARGLGGVTPLAERGIGAATEKDVLTAVVDAPSADAAFELVYRKAGIGEPHGGILYMARLGRHTGFELPDLPDET